MTDNRGRVAYVVTPITFGGAEKVSLNFLRTVNRDRFDIRPILLVRPWEEEPYFAREINKLGYQYETIPVARNKSVDPLRVPRVARRLYATLKQGAFDLVHTHGYFADICGLPAARVLGLRNLTTCHGFIKNNFKLRTYNHLDKHAIKLSQKVIAVSDGVRSDLVHSGIKDSRIVVIPNAVPLPACDTEKRALRKVKRNSLGIGPRDYVVGFTGRLSREKGVNYLIDAVSSLHVAGHPVKLLIIGDGPEKEVLEQMARDRGLGSSVLFAGFQTDIGAWLSACDVLSLPSITEGTPLSILEAMSMGVPVIASAVGGVPDVVREGVNGFLVEPGNVDGISNKTSLLMQNKELARKIIAEGIRTINANYGISRWCERIEQLYEAV